MPEPIEQKKNPEQVELDGVSEGIEALPKRVDRYGKAKKGALDTAKYMQGLPGEVGNGFQGPIEDGPNRAQKTGGESPGNPHGYWLGRIVSMYQVQGALQAAPGSRAALRLPDVLRRPHAAAP